jgi:hypothetical protein
MNHTMTLRTTVALLFTFALTTGCSMTHGDPKNPKKNPHPVKRYEVIATSEAPGPWDSVKGYLSYEVVNPACTPEDKFLGVHAIPQDVGHDIEMTRVDEKTWKGYFYRDFMQDEDYYGLGICHWDATSVGGVFVVHGETFGSGDTLEMLLNKGPQTQYFKKSDFLNRSLTDGGYGTTATDPEVAKHPDVFFPITVTVKESTP